ncbi:MAG: MarR family transcriptional regulator [Clostridiales bacterium]|nr:MarR family transcriptional regulator [Clostridiales bacterium]
MNYKKTAEEIVDKLSVILSPAYHLKVEGVTKGEVFILNYIIASKGPVHPKQISDIMGISSARVSVVLNNLESKGEIRRISDSFDKRRTVIEITEKGREKAIRRRGETVKRLARVLENMGEDETKEFFRTLSVFCKAVSEKQRNQGNN